MNFFLEAHMEGISIERPSWRQSERDSQQEEILWICSYRLVYIKSYNETPV